MNAHETRVLKRAIDDLAAGRCSVEEVCSTLGKLLPEKRARLAKQIAGGTTEERKEAIVLSHREETTTLRGEAIARADGRCEAPHCRRSLEQFGGSMDHWRGGSGRRRQEQSLKTVWILCLICDRARTHNRPSGEFWNKERAAFCAEQGIHFDPHVEHAPVVDRRLR